MYSAYIQTVLLFCILHLSSIILNNPEKLLLLRELPDPNLTFLDLERTVHKTNYIYAYIICTTKTSLSQNATGQTLLQDYNFEGRFFCTLKN